MHNDNHEMLTEKDRDYCKCPEFNNCTICLVNAKGRIPEEEILEMLGISRQTYFNDMKKAMIKMKKRLLRNGFDPDILDFLELVDNE
jgi:hypothetical protein